MSILRGMYSGVSGLGAESEALSVVADNVANAGTAGFKQQRALFEDALGHSMTQDGPGAGVRVGSVQQAFTQGTLAHTGVSGDLALTGEGFFILSGSQGGLSGDFYARNGAFHLDADGQLVNQVGLEVQGYAAAPRGAFAAGISTVRLPTAALPAQPTSSIQITANLDASAQPPSAPWDPQAPELTSNFATSLRVYDSLGNAHDLAICFRTAASGLVSWYAVAEGGDLNGGTAGQNVVLGEGALLFDTNGALQSSVTVTPTSVDFVGATPGQAIDLVLGTSLAASGSGLDGVTQFASPFNFSALSQDGYTSGSPSGFVVNAHGVVSGLYTNGELVPVAQLAVATFRAKSGLGRAGDGVWIATRESGSAALGTAGTGRGGVSQGALEQSNVDLAEQFVGLIGHQRAFQANSKVISTADDMLAELVALKR